MTTESALTVIGEPEEYEHEQMLGDFAQAAPKEDMNFADDQDVVDKVRSDIIPILIQTRSDRAQLEEEWRQVRRMLMLIHDAGRRYFGRSDAYIPAWARTQGTVVSGLVRGLFPSDDFIEAVADDEDVTAEDVKDIKTMMQDVITTEVKLRAQMKLCARDYVNYGLAIAKVGYKKEIKRKVKLKKRVDGQLAAEMKEYTEEGARVYARSPFHFYVYPQTANSLEECTVIFEDIDISKAFLDKLGQQGVFKNTENVGRSNVPEHDLAVTSQLIDVTKSGNSPLNNSLGDIPQGKFYTLTEVWTEMVMPAKAYLPGEDTSCPISVKIVMAWDTILEVTRNTSWSQRPPYRVVRHEPMTGTFYGRSDGLRVRSLQYLTNDFANQTNDNGVYMLNPIAIVNPALMAGPMPPLRPGATIPTTDTAHGIRFDRPPFEQVQTGMQMEQSCISQIQDFAGAPPALQGQSGNKNAKTATGMQLLQRNALGPIQDVVEDFENDMLVPLLLDIQGVLEQYAPDTFWIRDGQNRRPLSRALLSKRFGWRWLASSQAVNQQQRAQNLLNFIPLVAQLAPMLQQGGYMVNLEPLLQRIYNDGFGMRGFDKIVVQAQPGMVPGQPGMPPGVPGQQGAPGQGDPAASALRNSNNPADQEQGQTMQPGEGDEYANVRQEADQIAGAMGAQYGAQ